MGSENTSTFWEKSGSLMDPFNQSVFFNGSSVKLYFHGLGLISMNRGCFI